MQLKMYQILDFPTCYEAIKSQKLPVKVAYKFAQLARAIEKEHLFYQEKLQEIIQEYGEKNEEGGFVSTEDKRGIKLRPGTDADCNKAVKELRDLDISLPDISFTFDELEAVELTVDQMQALIAFLSTEE